MEVLLCFIMINGSFTSLYHIFIILQKIKRKKTTSQRGQSIRRQSVMESAFPVG